MIDDDRIPLYRLLAESRIQVGIHSTALYEGLSYGLASILLDRPGLAEMRHLVDQCYATVVRTAAELASAIDALADDAQLHTEPFFKSGALDTINKQIERLYPKRAAN